MKLGHRLSILKAVNQFRREVVNQKLHVMERFLEQCDKYGLSSRSSHSDKIFVKSAPSSIKGNNTNRPACSVWETQCKGQTLRSKRPNLCNITYRKDINYSLEKMPKNSQTNIKWPYGINFLLTCSEDWCILEHIRSVFKITYLKGYLWFFFNRILSLHEYQQLLNSWNIYSIFSGRSWLFDVVRIWGLILVYFNNINE